MEKVKVIKGAMKGTIATVTGSTKDGFADYLLLESVDGFGFKALPDYVVPYEDSITLDDVAEAIAEEPVADQEEPVRRFVYTEDENDALGSIYRKCYYQEILEKLEENASHYKMSTESHEAMESVMAMVRKAITTEI